MRRICISSLLLLVTAFACQRQPAAREGGLTGPAPTPAATTQAAPAPAPAPKPVEAAPQPYMVRIVPGSGAAGQAVNSVIEVSPAAGFHINQEFPVKLKLLKTDGVDMAKKELGKEDAEINEKALRFTVRFTPKAPGKVALTGTADFSVCNDTTCKLIRDEQLSWEVDVK
jgi:hypothetical protein